MRHAFAPAAALSLLLTAAPGTQAQDKPADADLTGIDKPASQLQEVIAQEVDLPAGTYKIRVVTATVDPKTAAGWHTHPSPVYVFVRAGALTMDVEGKEVTRLEAGDATAEPLDARMRVLNEGDAPAELVVFQVSPVDKDFLEQQAQDAAADQ